MTNKMYDSKCKIYKLKNTIIHVWLQNEYLYDCKMYTTYIQTMYKLNMYDYKMYIYDCKCTITNVKNYAYKCKITVQL